MFQVNVLNRIGVILSVFVSAILLFSIGSSVSSLQFEPVLISSSDPEPFYIGVTYCGDSVSEAKQLIDKVKEYTNLFVLQSGPLQSQPDKISEIVTILWIMIFVLLFILAFTIGTFVMNGWRPLIIIGITIF